MATPGEVLIAWGQRVLDEHYAKPQETWRQIEGTFTPAGGGKRSRTTQSEKVSLPVGRCTGVEFSASTYYDSCAIEAWITVDSEHRHITHYVDMDAVVMELIELARTMP